MIRAFYTMGLFNLRHKGCQVAKVVEITGKSILGRENTCSVVRRLSVLNKLKDIGVNRV